MHLHQSPKTFCYPTRSSSGNTDIPIILLAKMRELNINVNVYLNNDTGKRRNYLHLSLWNLPDTSVKALLVSSVFLGNWDFHFLSKIEEKMESVLPKKIYNEKRSGLVNIVRSWVFWNKLEKGNQVIDMSPLPPCRNSLKKF